MTAQDTPRTPEDVLQAVYGHSAFRTGQRELIDHIIHQDDVVGVMPTGAGKSVCYQVPALLMPGLTLVVSPLISLMKDQVTALTQQGVPAAYINSSLTPAQQREALRRAEEGRYKIIYAAPERLLTGEFLRFAQNTSLSQLCVDEAHCVSQWGQDFRPSYLQIGEFVDSLPRRPVLSAFTATATARVRQDIIEMLRLHRPHVVSTGFDRPNLHFAVRQPGNKVAELLAFLGDNREANGIVYCATRKSVEQVCEVLCKKGFAATRYHAGLDPEERAQNQEDFLFDRKRVMVATNAFGMGIDKSDVRFVVHYNMPANMESYYQEAGRAGRDGERAVCLLLYSPKDEQTQRFLIDNGNPPEDMPEAERAALRKNAHELLRQMTHYATTADCLRAQLLRYFGEAAPDYCGDCSVCHTGYEEHDITQDAQKVLSCVVRMERMGRSFGRAVVADTLRGTASQRVCAAGLDTLPTYGAMTNVTRRHTLAVIDYLIREGALTQTTSEYPVLAANAQTMKALRSEETLTLRLPKGRQPRAERKAAEADLPEADLTLLQTLKELRLRLARTDGVPAYVVFTDATLIDICRRLPQNTPEFLAVSGVGMEKNKRYGEVFIEAVREHCARQNPPEQNPAPKP